MTLSVNCLTRSLKVVLTHPSKQAINYSYTYNTTVGREYCLLGAHLRNPSGMVKIFVNTDEVADIYIDENRPESVRLTGNLTMNFTQFDSLSGISVSFTGRRYVIDFSDIRDRLIWKKLL